MNDLLSVQCARAHPDLHSFPTRRSSDLSRTGMWQYDTKTVYVPFDVLQKDLGMNAKDIFVPVTVFSADSPAPQRVLGTAQAKSEEHTSELQSHVNLVCRLLLEKKKDYIL